MVDFKPTNQAPAPATGPQLKYPLDADSLKALSAALDILLPDKIFDLMWNNVLNLGTALTTPTVNVTGTSTVSAINGAYQLLTDNTSGHLAEVILEVDQEAYLSLMYRSSFRSTAQLHSGSANPGHGFTAYIVYGNLSSPPYYGFKFVRHSTGNGTLVDIYGCAKGSSGSEQTVLITSAIFEATQIDIEANYRPSQNTILFSVFGTQFAKLQVNLGAALKNVYYMDAKMTTNNSFIAEMWIGYYEVLTSQGAT